MSKSKVDRVRDVWGSRIRQAVEEVAFREHRAGRPANADVLMQAAETIRVIACSLGTYERLELDDIIKGHKRAWPE